MKKRYKLSMTIRIGSLLMGLLLAAFITNANAQIIFDGVNCNATPNSSGTSWEWDPADAYIDVDPVGSSIPGSSDIDSLWTTVQDQYLTFAFSRAAASTGGAGNAGFKFHFNTDCDTTTGETDFNGADAALFFSIQSGVVQDSAIYVWTGSGYTPSGDYFTPLIGGSSCSDSADARFFEFKVHVSKIYDLCSGYACGGITITAANVHAGGSFNSIIKDSLLLDVDVFINDPPVSIVSVDPTELCSGDSASFNASSSTENTVVNTAYDSIVSYEWDMSYDSTVGFSPTFGVTGATVDYPFFGYTTHYVALRTTDVFGCKDTLGNIELQTYTPPVVDIIQTLDQSSHLCRNLIYDGTQSYGYAPSATLSYYWEFPDNTTSTLDSLAKSYPKCIWSYTTYASLTVTDDKGCASTASAAPPVPVELLCFQANLVDGNALLTWQTASEINNDYFEILKSYNGLDFESIGRVTGAGNSNEVLEYSFIDSKPVIGLVYYQLMQVDYDGTATPYGPIVLEGSQESSELKFYPNPTNSTLIFEPDFESKIFSIQMIDQCGKVMWNESYDSKNYSNKISIDLMSYSKGLYYFIVGNDRVGYRYKLIELQ
ncbi:MAG: T9SS type A sorting domain-containing protein [Bacteroidia bacterium]